jgi:hypothetical protein
MAARAKANKVESPLAGARYSWRPGLHYRIPAEVAKQCIDQIRSQEGKVTPGRLVDAAADAEHPLHPEFDWDNDSAARKFRLQQARKLITAIVVEYDRQPDRSYPQFINIRHGQERGYIAVTTALEVPEARQEILEQAKSYLQSFRRRYQNLQELASVVSAIDAYLDAA